MWNDNGKKLTTDKNERKEKLNDKKKTKTL